MYRALLVPLDGSSFGEHALPLALGLARRAGASLCLARVHVPLVPGPVAPEGLPALEDLTAVGREHERAYLERVRDSLAPTGVRVGTALLEGSIAHAISTAAVTGRADLIVMTTHGFGGLERLWLGSVADELVRSCHVPLLMLRPREGAPALAHPTPLRTIHVPLDGSPLSEEVLPLAVDLGLLTDARYVLVHVTEPFNWVGRIPGGSFAPVSDVQFTRRRESEAHAYLEDVARRLRERGLEVTTRVVVSAHPALALLDHARQDGADLLAMATHGRGGLARLLVGSVADKVMRGAAVPVLLYRPREGRPER